jgi:hypothetical protein
MTPSPDSKLAAMLDEDTMNWDVLRAQSLRPGGFGKERTRVWCVNLLQLFISFVQLLNLSHAGRPALLGVRVPSEPPPYAEVSPEPSINDPPHPDERQVRLDTDRSFVMYPVGNVSHDCLPTSVRTCYRQMTTTRVAELYCRLL